MGCCKLPHGVNSSERAATLAVYVTHDILVNNNFGGAVRRRFSKLHPCPMDFIPVHRNILRGNNSQLDAVSLDANDFDPDVAGNNDFFTKLARKYQHDKPSMVVSESNSFLRNTQNQCQWFISSTRH